MKPPLSERLRPESLDEVVGHPEILNDKGWIRHVIRSNRPLSFLLYGPPGSGKTTIARLFGKSFKDAKFIALSAVATKVQDIRKIIDAPDFFGQKTILFLDEIHRFNKAQQDLFLPKVEDGSLILIGATTENPSFTINNALLSRLRVISLRSLDQESMEQILERYEQSTKRVLPEKIRRFVIERSSGDARHLINLLENLEDADLHAPFEELTILMQKKAALYDRDQEGHYNLISALHKTVRGSDPDGALYWLTRMLNGGEDPLFLARRLIRMAVEDIGLADPEALSVSLQAHKMYQILGSPEGELGLAQAVIYLALAPKSNSVYTAMKSAQKDAENTSHLDPPKHILNAPTKWMKEMGYGKGYVYDHDLDTGVSKQTYFPEEMGQKSYYEPVLRGFERDLSKRLQYFQKMRSTVS